MNLRVLARCKKCGREFVTLGSKAPKTDPYGDPDWKRPRSRHFEAGEWPACGGEIELTPEGMAQDHAADMKG